jgi:hypothetical protein
MAFLDGDDVCADCGVCCTDTQGLRLTGADLERLPAFVPLVTRSDGPFSFASWSGPCPYLGADKRCTVFAARPGDCGAYPVDVSSIGVRQPDGRVEVRYRFEAGDCPERPEMLRRAVGSDTAPLSGWLGEALGAEVELAQDPRQVVRTRVLVALHRTGVLAPLLRRLGRLPQRPAA